MVVVVVVVEEAEEKEEEEKATKRKTIRRKKKEEGKRLKGSVVLDLRLGSSPMESTPFKSLPSSDRKR